LKRREDRRRSGVKDKVWKKRREHKAIFAFSK